MKHETKVASPKKGTVNILKIGNDNVNEDKTIIDIQKEHEAEIKTECLLSFDIDEDCASLTSVTPLGSASLTDTGNICVAHPYRAVDLDLPYYKLEKKAHAYNQMPKIAHISPNVSIYSIKPGKEYNSKYNTLCEKYPRTSKKAAHDVLPILHSKTNTSTGMPPLKAPTPHLPSEPYRVCMDSYNEKATESSVGDLYTYRPWFFSSEDNEPIKLDGIIPWTNRRLTKKHLSKMAWTNPHSKDNVAVKPTEKHFTHLPKLAGSSPVRDTPVNVLHGSWRYALTCTDKKSRVKDANSLNKRNYMDNLFQRQQCPEKFVPKNPSPPKIGISLPEVKSIRGCPLDRQQKPRNARDLITSINAHTLKYNMKLSPIYSRCRGGVPGFASQRN